MAVLGKLSQALHGHCTAILLTRPASCSLVPASHLSELQPRHTCCLCRMPWLGNMTPNQHRRNDPVRPLPQGQVQKPRPCSSIMFHSCPAHTSSC